MRRLSARLSFQLIPLRVATPAGKGILRDFALCSTGHRLAMVLRTWVASLVKEYVIGPTLKCGVRESCLDALDVVQYNDICCADLDSVE